MEPVKVVREVDGNTSGPDFRLQLRTPCVAEVYAFDESKQKFATDFAAAD